MSLSGSVCDLCADHTNRILASPDVITLQCHKHCALIVTFLFCSALLTVFLAAANNCSFF